MKKIKFYQVDSFANEVFSGNPAGVCLLEEEISSELMQKIALENQLSETAFIFFDGENYSIRYFTPQVEVPLCGHATLASAFILFKNHEQKTAISLQASVGTLHIKKNAEQITMNLPCYNVTLGQDDPQFLEIFAYPPKQVYLAGDNYILIYESEEKVRSIKPNYYLMKKYPAKSFTITAVGEKHDFVSRHFAPQLGIDEDPVTGVAHTYLTPLWSKLLEKKKFKARQVSKRGGEVECHDLGERIEISGKAQLYLEGFIYV